MRNPFAPHRTREQVDGAFEQLGWGTKIERRVPREGGEPLYFQLRLPNDIQLVEVGDLVPAAQELPTWLEDRAVALDQARAASGLVVVGGLSGRGTPDDVFTTLTVVHSEHVKDPGDGLKEGTTREERPGEKAIVHVNHLKHDRATLVQRTSMISLSEGAEPIPMITVTFLKRTKFGGLALTFCSTHDGGGSEEMKNFYANVYGTLYLGDSEPPTDGKY